jgi:hypothetical protein
MRKIIQLCSLMLLIFIPVHRSFAQESTKSPEPPHYFRVDYVVVEVGEDGKPTNSRTYTDFLGTDDKGRWAQTRSGTRVPLAGGGEKNEVNYIDMGVDIDAGMAIEVGRQLAFSLTVDITSLATPVGLSTPGTPVIRQCKWRSMVLVPPGKSTMVFSSDNLENKGKTEVLVTATPLQ